MRIRLFVVCTAAVLLLAPMLSAQADVAGEWRVEFATPSGPADFTMFVSQSGAKLNGRLTNEVGEFPMTGNVDGNQVRIVWQFPDVGRLLDITFTGKIDGDKIEGKASIEKVGEGPMSAQRTSR